MISQTARRAAAVAVALVGVIHLALTPEYLDEKVYVGVLFAVGGAAELGLAAWLWLRNDAAAWLLSAAAMVGMGGGFILSRTVGLPGFHESEWELSGLVCLMLEAAVVAILVRALATASVPQPSGATTRGALTDRPQRSTR